MSQPSRLSNKSLIRRLVRWPAWIKITAYSLVGLGVAAGATYLMLDSRPIISRQATEGATFPVYVPTKTPAGYAIEPVKTKLTSDMLTYSFAPDNKEASDEIVVTVQPLPKDFSMTKLIGSGSVTTTTTSNGTLYDLSTSKKSQYLLNTGDALIFFTSIGNIDTLTINSLVADLVKQK